MLLAPMCFRISVPDVLRGGGSFDSGMKTIRLARLLLQFVKTGYQNVASSSDIFQNLS